MHTNEHGRMPQKACGTHSAREQSAHEKDAQCESARSALCSFIEFVYPINYAKLFKLCRNVMTKGKKRMDSRKISQEKRFNGEKYW